MRRRVHFVMAGAGLAVALAARPAAAQGTLSVQGLGYPPGQFGARSMGTDGALADFDPTSAVNPAALLEFGGAALSAELAPEFRRDVANGNTASSSTQRFPVFIGALPMGDRLIFGISSSTLLDRTWQTTTPQSQLVGGDTVQFNSNTKSDGSVNDIALTAAYTPANWLRLGVAVHAIAGRDVVTSRLTFADTVRYGNTAQPFTNTFSGNAVSVGAELIEPSVGGVALTYRRGGPFEQTVGDTLIASARVPDQFDLGLVFTGFSGSAIAFRTSYVGWSSLGSLDSPSGPAMNSWDTSFGAEFTGQRLGSVPLDLRIGGRVRDLPFPADGHRVREASAAGGLGLTLAGGHATVDFALVRSARSAGIGVSESAWTMSAGLTIRP